MTSYWHTDTASTATVYQFYDWSGTTTSGTTWYNSQDFWARYLPSKFLEKRSSMPLEDFLNLWRKDGFKLVEIETKELEKGLVAKRYNVYSDEFYEGYGRHLGIVVVLNRSNRVVNHEVFNILGDG